MTGRVVGEAQDDGSGVRSDGSFDLADRRRPPIFDPIPDCYRPDVQLLQGILVRGPVRFEQNGALPLTYYARQRRIDREPPAWSDRHLILFGLEAILPSQVTTQSLPELRNPLRLGIMRLETEQRVGASLQ